VQTGRPERLERDPVDRSQDDVAGACERQDEAPARSADGRHDDTLLDDDQVRIRWKLDRPAGPRDDPEGRREQFAAHTGNTRAGRPRMAWPQMRLLRAYFLTTVVSAVAVALSLLSAAVNVSEYEPTSPRFTFLVKDWVNVSPAASVTTCVCALVEVGPTSVFVSVSVSVTKDLFVTDSVAVAVVPATTVSGYDTETVNDPLDDKAESDEAKAAPAATAAATSAAAASMPIERRNDFKMTPWML
jgi:hypothetical protein